MVGFTGGKSSFTMETIHSKWALLCGLHLRLHFSALYVPIKGPVYAPPTPQTIHDWHLGLFVAGLVVVDLLILQTYTVVEGIKGALTARLVPSLERTVDVQGVGENISVLITELNAFHH